MADWRTVLREMNARDEDDRLSTDDAESIRRAMLAAAARSTPKTEGWSWMRPTVVAAAVVAMVAVGIVAERRLDVSVPAEKSAVLPGESNPEPLTADSPAPNRQLQFLTPGGTRIIWVFNSEFDLKATLR